MNAFVFETRYRDRWQRDALRRESLDHAEQIGLRDERVMVKRAIRDIFDSASHGVQHVGDTIKRLERYREWVDKAGWCDEGTLLAKEVLGMLEGAIDMALSRGPISQEKFRVVR